MALPRRQPVRCPCGSRERFVECCGALHRGRASGSPTATTAERLMRSRFSAFAVGDVDYLLATWHPSTRPATLELDDDLSWTQLDIVDVDAGGDGDNDAIVEFVAYFRDSAGAFGQQRERSAFVRESGQWYYVGLAA